MSVSQCLFPEWRRSFVDPAVHAPEQGGPHLPDCGPILTTSSLPSPSGFSRPLLLPQLDLASVQRDEGPPSESILKRQKFALYEKQCSKVAEGLFISGEYVAKSRDILREHGITHIVNCVGALYPEYFSNDGVEYKTLWLQDSPSEDLLCILYDTFEFIDMARGGIPASPVPCSGISAVPAGLHTPRPSYSLHAAGSRPTSGLGSIRMRPHSACGAHMQAAAAAASAAQYQDGLAVGRSSSCVCAAAAAPDGSLPPLTATLRSNATLQQQQLPVLALPQLARPSQLQQQPGPLQQQDRAAAAPPQQLQQQAAAGAGDGVGALGAAAAASGSSSPAATASASSSAGPAAAAHAGEPAESVVRGHVLVHCSQGVSRSSSVAIAYIMWLTGQAFDEAYSSVRALRGVASPNIGFTCQLLQWQKRRTRPPARLRLYRIAPHCSDAPGYLVPRAVPPLAGCSHADWRRLDPRGCFVAHLPSRVYVWRGAHCMMAMVEAGCRAAALLRKYEEAGEALLVCQGEEPDELLAALTPSLVGAASSQLGEGSRDGGISAAVSTQPSRNLGSLGADAGAAAAGEGVDASWNGAARTAGARCDDAPAPGVDDAAAFCSTAALTHQLSRQLSERVSVSAGGGGGGGCGLASEEVVEREEYNAEFELFYRAFMRSTGGGGSDSSGRPTPRHSASLLAAHDDSVTASRPESPATIEGRGRKYRRSESERCVVSPLARLGSTNLTSGGGGGASSCSTAGGGGAACGGYMPRLPPLPVSGAGLAAPDGTGSASLS